MANLSDWIPSQEDALVKLMEKWNKILTDPAKRTAFGWSDLECGDVCSKMNMFVDARSNHISVNSTANRVAKDDTKKDAVEAMRDFARSNVRFNKKMDNETRVFMGMRIPDTVKTTVPVPQAQCTVKVSNPGLHMVAVEPVGYALLTADQRSTYGVRIFWGIVPQVEVTLEMAAGPKHYLAKPPLTGDVLGNSVFTRKLKHLFDFDGDSGNRVYFCCHFENSKGDVGPFGPIITAIIT
jgi:hypothetical protein